MWVIIDSPPLVLIRGFTSQSEELSLMPAQIKKKCDILLKTKVFQSLSLNICGEFLFVFFEVNYEIQVAKMKSFEYLLKKGPRSQVSINIRHSAE